MDQESNTAMLGGHTSTILSYPIDHPVSIIFVQSHHYSCQVEGLAKAMDTLTFLGRKWTKGHFTEVLREDDETYGKFNGALPQCKT